ncbi:MAG: RhuM family protein, partial [Candidatus Woesebacteria bacterium]|nr:RhuM family protein [Candidatus Woesebacteria bacterium]
MKKDNNKLTIRNSTAEFLIFTSQAGEGGIEVRVEDENVWLTQKLIAKLFGVEVNTINYHLKEVFKSGEQDEISVIRNFRITATDGKNYETNHYSLEAIIAIGFKVNSNRAVEFRRWAGNILKDFAIRGYVLD